MAQKDAKVNIALAESSAAIAKAGKEDSAVMRTIAIESKKDSSAMKTIAVLGMFFLPGTFVAAIFAMPVFDWDGNTLIVKPGFKYYWAVTAPLTLFVLLSWSLAMLLPWKSWLSTIKGGRKALNRDVELTS
jgi:Mg2+ and Co2+ transporter CorA